MQGDLKDAFVWLNVLEMTTCKSYFEIREDLDPIDTHDMLFFISKYQVFKSLFCKHVFTPDADSRFH